MRHAVFALAALATTLAATPAGAEPVMLKPLGPWNVDFGEDSCRLQRLFGTDADKHVLMFQQYWPDSRAGLTLAGPLFGTFRSDDRTELSFFDGQAPIRTTAFSGNLGDYGDALIFSTVSFTEPGPRANRLDDPAESAFRAMDLDFGKQARFVAVKQGGREVRFATGAMNAAFEVLNQCTLEQVRALGVDVEKYKSMRSRPRWLNQAALTRRIIASYPSDARAQGEQGIMRMQVIVDAQGKVESCRILKATTTQRLESPACDVMQRAEFAPALDAEGKPFRALYATSITYRMAS
ncbi:MAG: energy transducer TonB [Erythrobacter sp.]